MSERFSDFKTKHNSESHIRECATPRCLNKVNNKSKDSTCQSCLESKNQQMVTALADIRKFKTEIATTKITLQRLQENIDTEINSFEKSSVSKFNLEDLQKQAVILTRKIDFLEQSLLRSQILVKYNHELVSNDHKYYDGRDNNGKYWTLETHCTIVRVQNSPEDVFFGHVTLVISKNENTKIIYKWHYGIETFPFNLPKDLNNEFWYYDNKLLPPESTQVSSFANFSSIPNDTLLSDIMKYHLDKCVRSFRTRPQWKNQVWKPNDKIDGEDATSLIERLKKIQRDSASYDPANHQATLEQLKEDIKQKEEQRKKIIDERQKAEASAKKAEADDVAKKAQEDLDKKALYDPTELSEAEKTWRTEQSLKSIKEWEKDSRERRAAEEKDKQEQNAKKIAQMIEKEKQDRKAKIAADEKKAKAKAIEVAKNYQKVEKSRALQQNADEIEKKTVEDALQLERILKERITQAKIYVDEFLKEIQDAGAKIESAKNDIKNKEKNELYLWSEQSFKDTQNLMKECNKLISYIEKNMEKFEKEIDLLEDKTPKIEIYKHKFMLLDFKNNVYRSNLEDIQKWESIYKTTILPKEKLLTNDDYRRNPDNIDEIHQLYAFYEEFMDIAVKWISSLHEFKLLLQKEDHDMLDKSMISLSNTIIPDKRSASVKLLSRLVRVTNFYNTYIIPKEKKLKDSTYRRDTQSFKDISSLVDFYKDGYEQIFVQGIVNKINFDDFEPKYATMIKKDIKFIEKIINKKQSLARVQILMKILEYNSEIKDKEEKLLTLYRQEREAMNIIDKLISFYREYLNELNEWNSSLSNLEQKDDYIIDNIRYLKSLIQNPEQFLESLYMMYGHTLIDIYAKQPDGKDEPEEYIVKNVVILTLNQRPEAMAGLVKTMKQEGPFSTKQAISKFKLPKNKLEERKKLLKEDAYKLIRLVGQEKVNIETQLANIDPMTDEAKVLRNQLKNMYLKYAYFTKDLISHIKAVEINDNSILELNKFSTDLQTYIYQVEDDSDAYNFLYEMEEYYNEYIKPGLVNLHDLSIDQLNSLRAYYQTFNFDLKGLVVKRIGNLKSTDIATDIATDFIKRRIQTLTDKVKPNANLRILKAFLPPDSAPSVTKDQTQLFDSKKFLIEYYNLFSDDENEKEETIIRNFMIFQPQISYPIAKDIVTHIKNFRDKMYNQKTFSTKSVLQYYGSCL